MKKMLIDLEDDRIIGQMGELTFEEYCQRGLEFVRTISRVNVFKKRMNSSCVETEFNMRF